MWTFFRFIVLVLTLIVQSNGTMDHEFEQVVVAKVESNYEKADLLDAPANTASFHRNLKFVSFLLVQER